ncbi:MAG: sigma-54-dependent Fis family transcriptional regulator [Flavobacteriales bacterium]|nr:sigma-54-dependent Fis family transcriptional regulator [Flavobacteriales bacterium]MBP6643550.1 sigma-54-dependent Fis family transcriptional regulator [Flavobacteriales bacterium]
MKKQLSVLLVDDSRDMLELLRRYMNGMGLTPFTTNNVVDAIAVLEQSPVDLVITDLNMPEVSGTQLVRYITQHFPKVPVLVITGFPDVQVAVEVMKQGAVEFLVKPVTEAELRTTVEKVLGMNTVDVADATTETPPTVVHGVIGRSPGMQEVYRIIERTRNNSATILVSGESGTGKEVIARAIHYNSDRSTAPFLAVNCGAIPDQLLESELFGHTKGAFTGAATNRVGFFQAADGGTLFLDEIGNATAAVQAKLLRAVQEKEVTMLGGTKPQRINVRLISASNSDLNEMVRTGTFREDLYYRLNVINIHLPPLRDRTEDIPMLINHFNAKYSKDMSKKLLRIPARVMDAMTTYHWPGNVRELENFVHRLVIMKDAAMSMEDLPLTMKMESPERAESSPTLSLAQVEKLHIQRVLESVGQNKTKAAEILGIDRKTLREKLK